MLLHLKRIIAIFFICTQVSAETAIEAIKGLNKIMANGSSLQKMEAAKATLELYLTSVLSAKAKRLLGITPSKQERLGFRDQEEGEQINGQDAQVYLKGVLARTANTYKEHFAQVIGQPGFKYKNSHEAFTRNINLYISLRNYIIQSYKETENLYALHEHQALTIIELFKAFGYGQDKVQSMSNKKSSKNFNVYKYIIEDQELKDMLTVKSTAQSPKDIHAAQKKQQNDAQRKQKMADSAAKLKQKMALFSENQRKKNEERKRKKKEKQEAQRQDRLKRKQDFINQKREEAAQRKNKNK